MSVKDEKERDREELEHALKTITSDPSCATISIPLPNLRRDEIEEVIEKYKDLLNFNGIQTIFKEQHKVYYELTLKRKY